MADLEYIRTPLCEYTHNNISATAAHPIKGKTMVFLFIFIGCYGSFKAVGVVISLTSAM
ncbi:hypothetical protein MCHI_002459 [Candidatus Magnetoovum chiemensis]|nr:hypothetical protein MCHI_002459 [Candidatus Magnetoovum chiemensis]